MLNTILEFLIRQMAKVYIPETKINDIDVFDIKHYLKDGDCIVTRRDWELSNWFEKVFFNSFYGHCGIYLNGKVYEATSHGLRVVTIERFLLTKDGIGLCRLQGPDWTSEQITMMIAFCNKWLGEPYDYSFNWGTTAKWYCSKLVFMTWLIGNPISTEAIKVNEVLNEKRIMPQDIWNETIQLGKWGEQ